MNFHQTLLSTENVNPNIETKCMSYEYDFTASEIESIYSYSIYKNCRVTRDYILNVSNNLTSISCNKEMQTRYFSDNADQIYGGSRKMVVVWSKNSRIKKNSEFQLIKCSEKSIHAIILLKYKENISKRANLIRATRNPTSKNMNVLLLVLDSVSSKSFKANLPKTTEFLKSLGKNEGSFSFHEFDKTGVPEPFTRANMAQILFGKTEETLSKNSVFNDEGLEIVTKGSNKNQESAIWKYYRDMGYVTMFLHDTVWDYLSRFTGQKIQAHHVFTNIWKYLWDVTGTHDFSNKQRCIGTRNFHELSFDYTFQFFSAYRKNNKFGYLHLDAGHESTGNIRTLDSDLQSFLLKVLNLTEVRGESLALFLISDHGLKNIKNLQWDFKSFYDPRLAMTSLILSRDIETKWQIGKYLSYNQNKLTSRFDINLSLKQFAYFPFNISYDLDELKTYKEYRALSLISEYLPENRTCAEVGVSKEDCICKRFERVNLENPDQEIIKNEFISLLKRFFGVRSSSTCRLFENYKITKYEYFQLSDVRFGLDTFYSLQVVHSNAFVKATANFCTAEKIATTGRILNETFFPSVFFNLTEIDGFLQISSVETSERCLINLCKC